MALHNPDDVSAFLGDRETRLIAATYRDDERRGEIFILPQGGAATLKEWTRQRLRCMFDDCPAPALRAVSRAPRRRDGFSHGKGGGKHTPESVNHRQGKAVVAKWLRATYPTASVVVEQASDTQRSNIADVMLTLESGQRVAFEVQYAQLAASDWRRRHESYLEQGIIDIWLWGHTRVSPSRGEGAAGPFRLDDAQDELRQAGMRVTFLNPVTDQVGVATSTRQGRACLAAEREYSLMVEDLSRARVSPDGLTSHMIGPLAAVSNEIARSIAERLAEQARKDAEEEARATEEKARRDADDARRRAERAAQFDRDVERFGRNTSWLTASDGASQRPPGPAPTGPLDPEYAAANRLCRVCGLKLDPIITSGVHFGPCEERDGQRARHPGIF